MTFIKPDGMCIQILDCFVMVLGFHKMNSGKIRSFLQVMEMFELVVDLISSGIFKGFCIFATKAFVPFSV